jgi:hypothetical protein
MAAAAFGSLGNDEQAREAIQEMEVGYEGNAGFGAGKAFFLFTRHL